MVLNRILQITEICRTTRKTQALHPHRIWDILDSNIPQIMLWINAWLVMDTLVDKGPLLLIRINKYFSDHT